MPPFVKIFVFGSIIDKTMLAATPEVPEGTMVLAQFKKKSNGSLTELMA
ncbi:MAG: hypothetical protein HYT65_02375 [Candidatus Yanofskybacteria bacterium]|nr:hypothetical protein [Candidatus Yanofskybacteria bacterium]